MRTYFQKPFTLICLATLSVLYLSAQEQNFDTQRSSITVHVGKAGFLSVAGHEHRVRAPFSEGRLNATPPEHVTFRVDAKALNVRPDDTLSAEKQAEVQRTMQTEVLESDKYPEISFRSTTVERVDAHHWLVTGDLTLHGHTHPVRVDVSSVDGDYTGTAKLKQTDFGIRVITVGGLVKLRNELEIQFKVIPERSTSGH